MCIFSPVTVKLTFSMPKNLSLPSSRTVPAVTSIFSKGVTSGSASSFSFFFWASLAAGLEAFYEAHRAVVSTCWIYGVRLYEMAQFSWLVAPVPR